MFSPTLEIAYEETGDPQGILVILLHGFPYDPRSFDDVVPLLVAEGARVLVPWLRGFGATRFRDPGTMRSGQQAALGQDLVEFMDAVDVQEAILAGFDWGGRAACVVAAIYPDRVTGLVTAAGYAIQNIPGGAAPEAPDVEQARWYQHAFQHDLGRNALTHRRDEYLLYLWRIWSPTWAGAAGAYAASSGSFTNPDFVDVVIHSYRHRFGNTPGDPAYADIERLLTEQPPIPVPAVVLLSDADGVFIHMQTPEAATEHFTGATTVRVLRGIGHNPAQQAPEDFAAAVISLLPPTSSSTPTS